jgi:ubiquinone/menaquinone biosynthesis C-methylase UbiE
MNVVERLIPDKLSRVLDVGCGNIDVGGHLYCYNRLKKNYNIFGIDINPGIRRDVLKASATKIPFADSSIEYVISTDVIEHIKDFSSVILDMLRVSNRRVIIIVPTTSKNIVRKLLNIVRRMIGGAGSRMGEFILQGHYYEFFPQEILAFKGKNYSAKFYRINYPIIFNTFFRRTGIIYSGVYVFDKIQKK